MIYNPDAGTLRVLTDALSQVVLEIARAPIPVVKTLDDAIGETEAEKIADVERSREIAWADRQMRNWSNTNSGQLILVVSQYYPIISRFMDEDRNRIFKVEQSDLGTEYLVMAKTDKRITEEDALPVIRALAKVKALGDAKMSERVL